MSTWNLDHAHSTIGFKVKHLMVSSVSGLFTQFSGTIESPDDSFANATVHFTADAASISTHNEMRDNHLKSADFFDVAQFPTLSFTSTSFNKHESGYTVSGNFTMHGITKPITLTVQSDGIGTGMNGKRVVGFTITGTINRTDFGLTWNNVLETGGVAVGEEVKLDIHVEATEA